MYRIQIKQRRDCYLSDKFMTTDFPVIYPNITNIMITFFVLGLGFKSLQSTICYHMLSFSNLKSWMAIFKNFVKKFHDVYKLMFFLNVLSDSSTLEELYHVCRYMLTSKGERIETLTLQLFIRLNTIFEFCATYIRVPIHTICAPSKPALD